MKTQKVSVDVWAMFKSMFGYLALAILGGVFLRLVIAVVMLPRRLREQKENVQKAMDELRLKYPDAFKDIEEDLKNKNETADECSATEDDNGKPSTSVIEKKIN